MLTLPFAAAPRLFVTPRYHWTYEFVCTTVGGPVGKWSDE